ncbi:MAG: hypothetical protein JJE50_12950 [Actinomycetales bacterium]|nr:hypothetical protein [Actinomycetales bacterium]
MSEQAIDLTSMWHIVRRRFGVVLLAAALGGIGGGALAYLAPPVYSSTSKVLLPPAPVGPQASSVHAIDTQVQIVLSDAVLGPAGRAVRPELRFAEVAQRVDVEAPTEDVLLITARDLTPDAARALCEAVAQGELDYLERAASTVDEEARVALADRAATLKNELGTVDGQIKLTQARLRGADLRTSEGRADASALAALTAQQANLALQIDKIGTEIDATEQPVPRAGASASVIQHASPAVRTPLLLSYGLYGGLGALAMALLASLVVLIKVRRERTVHSRDQVADAIGIPVVASLRAHSPRSVAGWTSLLGNYAPPNVDTWTLRQLVRLLTPGNPASRAVQPSTAAASPSVLVVTLAGDSHALALGPQVASFAASTGLRTRLVAAQRHESASALWAAFFGIAPDEQPRPGLFVDPRHDVDLPADLTLQLAVVDRERPELHTVDGAVVTLLAVTAGAATADELAKVALAADDAGHPISCTVVVNADPFDRSTGRLLASDRAVKVPLPSLMTGSASATEATPLESRRRRR